MVMLCPWWCQRWWACWTLSWYAWYVHDWVLGLDELIKVMARVSDGWMAGWKGCSLAGWLGVLVGEINNEFWDGMSFDCCPCNLGLRKYHLKLIAEGSLSNTLL